MVAHEQGGAVQKDLYAEGLGNVLDLNHGRQDRKKGGRAEPKAGETCRLPCDQRVW
jgi:hypothetical protein